MAAAWVTTFHSSAQTMRTWNRPDKGIGHEGGKRLRSSSHIGSHCDPNRESQPASPSLFSS
jgi:hypothetical protein